MTASSATARRPTLLAAGDADRTRVWTFLSLALRVILSAGLFAAALWLAAAADVDWRQAMALGTDTLALCLMLCGATVLLLAWRWRIVASRLVEQELLPSMTSFARFIWIGLAVNQVLPTIVGGDAMRIALLTRQGMPAAGSAISVVADRLYGLMGLAILCLLGLPFLTEGLAMSSLLATALTGAAVLAGTLAVVFAGRYWSRARSLTASIRALISWRAGAILILAAIAGHLANISVFLAIAHALGIDLPLVPAVAMMSFILLATALPFSIAGWGLRELTLVQVFGQIDAGADKIILASVIYGLVLLVAQASGFLLLVGRSRP